MADNDQEGDSCKPLLKTNEAMGRLALYLSSIGRFPNATSGMLYPMYGHGEVPQAFCRRAVIKGCIYVLRMPVLALLVEKDSGLYKGVKFGSGILPDHYTLSRQLQFEVSRLVVIQQFVLQTCLKLSSVVSCLCSKKKEDNKIKFVVMYHLVERV